MKTDVRQYGSGELSLQYQNDEAMYGFYMRAVRRDNFAMLKEDVDELFIYNPEQLDELEEDFNADVLVAYVEEYNRE